MADPEPVEYNKGKIVLVGVVELLCSSEIVDIIHAMDYNYVVISTDATSEDIYRSGRRYDNTATLASQVILQAYEPVNYFEEQKVIPYCPVNTFKKHASLIRKHLTRRFNPRNDRLINKRKSYLKRINKNNGRSKQDTVD